jgi:hypothetical protein
VAEFQHAHKTPTIGRQVLWWTANVFIALVVLEGLLLFLLQARWATAASPKAVRTLAQQVYRHFNRMLIQFDAACAQYDPVVTYTLRPGTCTFENLEFKTQIRVNRLGLRDDDSALEGPEVIVLGDSHAMGWGVEQDEAFPRVAARRSGLRVLNAAVSSYGTARERMLLDRLDTSRLRVLVIQYSDNDVVENEAFRSGNNRLPITNRERYEEIVRYYRSQRSYYPGKYLIRLFLKITRLESPEPDALKPSANASLDEAELFLNAILKAGRTSLEHVQLVVLEINQNLEHPRVFTTALTGASRRPDLPPFLRRLITLDTSSIVGPDDFYVLDDHLTARGHARIGEALATLLGRLPADREDGRAADAGQSRANSSRQR